jgi:hypothetical protein
MPSARTPTLGSLQSYCEMVKREDRYGAIELSNGMDGLVIGS